MAEASEIDWERFDPASEPERAPRQSFDALDRHRVAGEDAPVWLPTIFACLGIAFALAATTSLSDSLRLREPPLPRTNTTEQEPLRPMTTEPAPPASTIVEQQPPLSEPPPAPIAEPTPRAETSPITADRAAPESAQATPIEPPCFPAIGIPFARGSARPILAGTEKTLETLLLWMTQRKDTVLLVEGHADSTGTERHNVLLSFWRAKAVVAWLAGSGVPEGRMIARAAGASESRRSSTGAAADRRAILRVEGVETCRDVGDIEKRQ